MSEQTQQTVKLPVFDGPFPGKGNLGALETVLAILAQRGLEPHVSLTIRLSFVDADELTHALEMLQRAARSSRSTTITRKSILPVLALALQCANNSKMFSLLRTRDTFGSLRHPISPASISRAITFMQVHGLIRPIEKPPGIKTAEKFYRVVHDATEEIKALLGHYVLPEIDLSDYPDIATE